MTQLPSPVDLDDLVREIRNSLLLHPERAGAARIVIESETGEQLHVLKIVTPCSPPAEPVLPLPHLAVSPSDATAATSSVQPQRGDTHDSEQQSTPHALLQRCKQQQQRIAELEQRLQQVQRELRHHAPSRSVSPAVPLSPTPSTDDESSSSLDNPHRSSGGETDEDVNGAHDDTVPMTDDADDASRSSSSPPPVPSEPTAVRRSERSKTFAGRQSPPTRNDVPRRTAQPSSPRKRRKTKRRQGSNDHDGEHGIASPVVSMDVDSVGDDDAAMEVKVLVIKLREGYDRRQSVALDSMSKESILSLREQVLEEEGDRVPVISGQITALITTSTSLKMVGYYLRAILAHRLKFTSQKYKRLARDTLGIKSSADIAAYPALYELVQHHYPTIASTTIEAWLENPIFSADITWTEWKRYLTKKGRLVIDAALQQFKAATAPFQDWMQLGWVEIYDDERLGGQGVRATRAIHMPTSKAKEAQRDLENSTSVVAADLHCAGSEHVLTKDAAREADDPMYHLQLDRQRVFDARHHWTGKINHLPDRLCNLRLTSTGKLVQIKPIAAGEALGFDYGVDYWVYQLSGLELSEWLVGGGVQSSKGTIDLFNEMHDSIEDYTVLLGCDWVKRRPAVWSELEREMWMGYLAECLEDASRKHVRVV